MNEEQMQESCVKCGNPADVEEPCWACDGKGKTLEIGQYTPQVCQHCGGSGKLAYCKKHAGAGARATPSSRARENER